MKKIGLFAAATLVLLGCNESALPSGGPAPSASAVAGLSADQAARVVAKIGDRTITLADFARTLERMDQFDRLRYQSKERRRELLDEMIDVQLLADEARRLGLDKDPEAQDAIRLILREAMIARARAGIPNPAQIPDKDVRAYYDAHQDKFVEPERRRISAIVMSAKDKKDAAKVLKEALKAKNANEWGELFFKHSHSAPKTRGPTNPAELAGDLGIVGPPSDPKGASSKVPEPVRAVAFNKLKAQGEVADELVEAGDKVFIVRLAGITPGHKRTLAEAERSIRVLILQDMLQTRERALDEELRRKFPIQVDDKALAAAKLPGDLEKWEATGASPILGNRPWNTDEDAGAPPPAAAPKEGDERK